MFNDEKKYGKAAKAATGGEKHIGNAKELQKKGSLNYEGTASSTSLQNLKDAWKTFKEGR